MTASVIARARSRCVMDCDCWLWVGWTCGNHPLVRIDGKAHYLRRVIYVEKYGPIPDGHRVVMNCESRMCVNPLHMTVETHSQTAIRSVKSTLARAAKISQARRRNSKLTPEAVAQIRASSASVRDEAAKHGVSLRTISLVRNWKVWREYHDNPFAGLGAR